MERNSMEIQNNILCEEHHFGAMPVELETVNINDVKQLSGDFWWLKNVNEFNSPICNENQKEFLTQRKSFQRCKTAEEQNNVTGSAEINKFERKAELEISRETQVDHYPTLSGHSYVQHSKYNFDQFQGEHEQYTYKEEYFKQYFKDINIYLHDVITQIKYEFDFKLNSCKTEMEAVIERFKEEIALSCFEWIHKQSNQHTNCSLDEGQNGEEEDAYQKGRSKCDQKEIISELESKLIDMHEKNIHLQVIIDKFNKKDGSCVSTIRSLNEQINENAEEYNMEYAMMRRMFDDSLKLLKKELEDSQKIHDQEILDLTQALDKQSRLNRKLNIELMETKHSKMKNSDLFSNNQIDQSEQNIPLVRKESEASLKITLIWDLVTKLNEIKSNIIQSTCSECEIKSVEASPEKDSRTVDLPDILQRTLNEVLQLTQSLNLTVDCKHSESLRRMPPNLIESTPNVESTNAEEVDGCRRSEKGNYCGVKYAGYVENGISPEETKHEKLIPLKIDDVLNLDDGRSSAGARVMKCTLNRLQALHLLSSARRSGNGLMTSDRPTNQLVSDGPSFVDNFSVYDRREEQLLKQTERSTLPVMAGGDYHTQEEDQDKDLMSLN